jgi:hypothetical protein
MSIARRRGRHDWPGTDLGVSQSRVAEHSLVSIHLGLLWSSVVGPACALGMRALQQPGS